MRQKVMIIGWGNLGRATHETIINHHDDLEVVAIVSRRPEAVRKSLPNAPIFDIKNPRNFPPADIAIICGGSKQDLPLLSPWATGNLSVKVLTDSFDTHGHIGSHLDSTSNLPTLGYYQILNALAQQHGKVYLPCQGWDPGIFSMIRTLFEGILPRSKAYAFYGLGEKGGLSAGHSDAIRTIKGVLDARSYTHAFPEAIEKIRQGHNPVLAPGDMHWRENFIVTEEGASLDEIKEAVEQMPNYFAGYTTTCLFVPRGEIKRNHQSMPHDGLVIASDGKNCLELRLKWDNNPQATARILVAAARAGWYMHQEGISGAFLPQEIPISALKQGDALGLIAQT